jgi:Tol biopolymer transport system component
VLAGAIAFASVAAAAAQVPPLGPEPQPDRARVIYVADGDLRTIAADGSDMRRFPPAGEDWFDSSPAWSPDASMIAFTRSGLDAEHEDITQVWVARADGSEARALTEVKTGLYEHSASWSPDGRELAVVRTRVGKSREVTSLVAINVADGSRRTLHSVATDSGDDSEVYFDSTAWSPRGDTVLYTHRSFEPDADDVRPEIHAVPSGGGQPRMLLRDAGDPAWSPDGNRIAYAGTHDRFGQDCDEDCIQSAEIYVANADGSGPVRLTTSRANDTSPSWSGDGQRIAFDSDRNATESNEEAAPPELYSIKPDGSCLTWLTNGTVNSEQPAFQPQAGLSSDPGACGPTAREPLVETDMRGIDQKRAFTAWWFGPVARNGLLLTAADASRTRLDLVYGDCGRFDPKECGEYQLVTSTDLCRSGGRLGDRPRRLSMFRGALLYSFNEEGWGSADLFTHRSQVSLGSTSGTRTTRTVIDMLRPVGGEREPKASFPSTRLPARTWRALKKRPAMRKRLAELGVKRRLGC